MKKNFKKLFKNVNYSDIETGAKQFTSIAYDLADWVVIAGIAIISSVMLGLLVFKIMAVGGLSAVLAELMASTCDPGVYCDFNIRMGGIGLALVVVTTFFVATIQLINYPRVSGLFDENKHTEPCKYYNEQQVEMLRTLQAMGGTKNLRRFANLMDIPYTTARNHIGQFKRDGYIKIHTNGQGSQIEIEVLQK